MGLSTSLAHLAARRLHVLVVEHPGAFVIRARAERALSARGWVLATSPADTDALLECGTTDVESQATAVEHVWSQVPGPRSRGALVTVAEVGAALDALAADYRQWSPPPSRPDGPATPDEHDTDDETDDMDDMDDMDMSGPGGIALASGSEDDRDGLEMDVLHLPLGPGLAGWPAGLTVSCTLSGDVIIGVEVVVTPSGRPDEHNEQDEEGPAATALRLDTAARVLGLAGAGSLAARARTARDQALDGTTPDLADLGARVRRSWTLRRALRRVGPVSPGQAADHEWPSAWVGDAYDRLLRLTASSGGEPTATTGLDTVGSALPDLLVGCELASARLTVASLVGHPS